MPKEKVLIIASDDLNNSGVPNVIYQTIKCLADTYSFDVVVFGDDLYYKKILEKDGISIKTIRFFEDRPTNKIKRFLWHLIFKHREYYKSLLKLLKTDSYNAIHSFKEDDSWAFLKAAKRAGINKRIIFSNICLQKPRNFLLWILWKKCRFLTNKFSTNRLGGSLPCCKSIFTKPFEVIHTSYDENKFNNSNTYQGKIDCLNLTHVANFCTNKNQLYTVDVFKEITKLTTSCKLRLIGQEIENNYLNRINEKINSLNLDKRSIEIYKSSNVADDLKQSSFLILPSFTEGAPLTVLEAQACGIRCFVSDKVTHEINCGGCVFIDINKKPEINAKLIVDAFNKYKNVRSKFDLTDFSLQNFTLKLKEIYNN